MSRLLELIRVSSPEERAEALAALASDTLATNRGPVAIRDAAARTVGYLSADVNAAATLPFPDFTPEEVTDLRRRAANPQAGVSVEEFIRQFDAATAEGK